MVRTAVRQWEHRLDWSQNDGDRFSSNLLPVLSELTDERLRLKHGITRASDPRRARELLGEPLWQLLAEARGRPPKQRELAGYVETLEQL
jgi:NTP pyrophosphatase (non-canonical NTP hydrolase)